MLKDFGALLERLWSNLGSLAHLGSLFELTWACLALFDAILGCLGSYLGLFEAILGYLGGILGPRASKAPPDGYACAPLSPYLQILEPILGTKIL